MPEQNARAYARAYAKKLGDGLKEHGEAVRATEDPQRRMHWLSMLGEDYIGLYQLAAAHGVAVIEGVPNVPWPRELWRPYGLLALAMAEADRANAARWEFEGKQFPELYATAEGREGLDRVAAGGMTAAEVHAVYVSLTEFVRGLVADGAIADPTTTA
jgi:hypothetical protein